MKSVGDRFTDEDLDRTAASPISCAKRSSRTLPFGDARETPEFQLVYPVGNEISF